MFFKRIINSFAKRSKTMRYFQNALPDYDSGDVNINNKKYIETVCQITSTIEKKIEPNYKNAQDGLYLGTAGIAYMYYHLSKVPALKQYKQRFLFSAVDYIEPALQVASKCETVTKDMPSFLLGNAGVYVVASAIFQATKDAKNAGFYREKFLRIAPICKNSFLKCGENELFVGRAGYLCAALWLAKETNTPLALPDLYDISSAIVASGRNYSKVNKSLCPLMYAYYDTEYLGAAHGLCSILQMLLCVPGYLDAHPNEAKDIKNSVDFLLELQQENGNFPCATDEINVRHSRVDELIHWCHGAPGVVYLMARAYILWGEQKYLQACEKSADLIWEKGLLRKGPGICHGVAGNGYAFLLLHRLTNEKKYLHRAQQFADFLECDEFTSGARKPDNPYSLYEGLAGTACFIADLTQPAAASFPFSDVF